MYITVARVDVVAHAGYDDGVAGSGVAGSGVAAAAECDAGDATVDFLLMLLLLINMLHQYR